MLDRFRIAMAHVLATFIYGCVIAIAARPFEGWTLVGVVFGLVAANELGVMVITYVITHVSGHHGTRFESVSATVILAGTAIAIAYVMASPELLEHDDIRRYFSGMLAPLLFARSVISTPLDWSHTADNAPDA